VAHFQRVAQREAVQLAKAAVSRKASKSSGSNFFGVGELPDDRSELWPELLQPLSEKLRHRFAGVRQNLAVGDETVCP
jgi:hypothetical protein